MKTKRTIIFAGLIALACTAFFLSCNTPIALGDKLDIVGPAVDFTYPEARTAQFHQFIIEGSASDRSRIKEMRITAEINGNVYAKQWRYYNGKWEVSQDYGGSWQPLGEIMFSVGIDAGARSAQWEGSENSASWAIPIDMSIDGTVADDGEYTFILQAWDSGNFSDDGSYKTRVYIIDKEPPLVSVTNPYLYISQYNTTANSFTSQALQDLHTILDSSITQREDPSYIGKFLTQKFLLQWQIEENVDIKTIDLRFYSHDVEIDGIEETYLPDNYIFRYYKDIPANELSFTNNVKPNGTIEVPALDSLASTGIYDGGNWELKYPITGKETIKVVALCYDGAANINLDNPKQEKVLGYFVYWPDADKPWISFPDGMEKLSHYGNNIPDDYDLADLEAATYMIYPGRKIEAKAFHAYGLKQVTYSLYSYTVSSVTISPTRTDITSVAMGPVIDGYINVTNTNEQKPNGGYSTVLKWEFEPPARSGYFVLKAQSFSTDNQSEEYMMFFRVQDITFPNFPVEPFPLAGEPLYKAVKGSGSGAYITISGYVSDATEVKSLSMVWINPKSRNFAAMSQLQYFRDSGYAGWEEAKKLLTANGNVNSNKLETENASSYPLQTFPYDPGNPNRLWNLKINPIGEDIGQDLGTGEREPTYRKLFEYSVDIPLSQLNIRDKNDPLFDINNPRYLESQVFLFRVENPDGKTSIITYAPQGDVLSPIIKIESVVIGSSTCIPGQYSQVPQFAGGETIIVNGSWEEDSSEFLDVLNYFYNNMEFSINEQILTHNPSRGVEITMTPANGTRSTKKGEFTITATVGNSTVNPSYYLRADQSYMKDTLVVDAKVQDIGGNPSESMASWLVESDTLRFLRLSSENEDTAYREGNTIEIYMEFNKPVKLKAGRANNPVLVLNTTGGATGIATYKTGQNNENVRQYFTYTVGAGQNVNRLNVRGISINGGSTVIETDSANNWQEANYPFAWEHTPSQGNVEEIRLTRVTSHTQAQQGIPRTNNGATFYARALPVSTNSPGTDNDYVFTLMGGKNIKIDTLGPTISGFSVSPTGWHGEGVEINITATFSENVMLGSSVPFLVLVTGNTTEANSLSDVRVNNDKITFKYIVKTGDNTGTNALTVTGFGGQVLDVPGTAMTAPVSGTLAGVYLDTTAPAMPTITVLQGTSPNGTQVTPLTVNLYQDNVFVRITGTANSANSSDNLGRIEYSLNASAVNSSDWTISSSTSSTVNTSNLSNGTYTIRARQIDQAGNASAYSNPVTFNLDSGNLVSSISSVNNGSFTRNGARQDVVSIQVNFRKKLSFTGTPQITLNATGNGTKIVNFTGTTAEKTNVDQLSFSYAVMESDTTSGTTAGKLDVTVLNLGTVTDGGVTVLPNTFINTLPATASRLAALNEIYIVTGPMEVVTNPTQPVYTRSGTGEEWAGTIAITFDRPISKGSGNLTITQSTTGYRLPAVLTEAQSSRYRSAAGFNTYYTRGTNGFDNAAGNSDTSTKFVLNYAESTVVTPANTSGLAKLAWDFRTAETVTIPVTSQDVTIGTTTDLSKRTLTITLTGSNALQVLGADYNIVIPSTYVQDNLGWPVNEDKSYTFTTPGVNKAYVRVDKQINKDTVALRTATGNGQAAGDNRNPWLTATHPLKTTARLDCRTPGSVVRYIANGTLYSATGTTTNGSGLQQAGSADDWMNTGTNNGGNGFAFGTQYNPENPGGQTAVNYTFFTGTGIAAAGPHISVGAAANGDDDNTNTVEQGFVWRITAKGRNSATGTTYSTDMSDEVALRTVLTVQITSMGDNLGTRPTGGDNLWIRGGDAVSSSSVPGFPLTWNDDWTSLQTEGKRAGIRLLRLTATPAAGTGDAAGLFNNTTWKWVSWEINVQTYFEVSLGREDGQTSPTVAKAWQYGPRLRAPQRGGWASQNSLFTMYPGKHRWIRIYQGSFNPGGVMNFSTNFINRPDDLPVTLTQ